MTARTYALVEEQDKEIKRLRAAVREGVTMAKLAYGFMELAAARGHDDELFEAGVALNEQVRDFRKLAIAAGFKIS